MSDKSQQIDDTLEQQSVSPETTDATVEQDNQTCEESEVSDIQKELDETKAQLENEKKEYLFLRAEFDNYKKRTLKEKSEIIRNGAESAMRNILPVIDDMERAINAMANSNDVDAVKEGIDLIYTKFKKYLDQNGVKEIATNGEEFNTEYHEAITVIPAPEESQKGKIIDTVEKGYTLNDKVLRYAKVVVGQ